MSHELLLSGLDGANPLAFLAALGTFRVLSLTCFSGVRLSWRQLDGAWRPMLHTTHAIDQEKVVCALSDYFLAEKQAEAFALGDNLGVAPERFRDQAVQAQQAASPANRNWADFLTSFGCEVTTTRDSKKQLVIQDTELRTMSGAGHQDFLAVARQIAKSTTASHLSEALFSPWRYRDSMEKQSMRWDPADDSRYALRWRNPSGDPSRRARGCMLGANRLALEAMPLFPVMPQGLKLRTTGFTGTHSHNTFWAWPIWEAPLELDVVRSVVAMSMLHEPGQRREMEMMGIREIYCSQRLTVGKYRNFTPARAL